jgi:hypothetical protein
MSRSLRAGGHPSQGFGASHVACAFLASIPVRRLGVVLAQLAQPFVASMSASVASGWSGEIGRSPTPRNHMRTSRALCRRCGSPDYFGAQVHRFPPHPWPVILTTGASSEPVGLSPIPPLVVGRSSPKPEFRPNLPTIRTARENILACAVPKVCLASPAWPAADRPSP